jgi:DedD protein
MAEPVDLNVDELRRRARRRLVGAVVLALGVAVLVPMLLETEQKPLGEDVSVKIPPIDDGKFVNRLNDKGAKYDTRTDAPASAAAPAAAATAPGSAGAAPPAAPATDGASASAKAPEAAAESLAAETARATAALSGRYEPPKAPAAAVAEPKASPTHDGFAVQLAAFADDKGANSLAGRLKRAGYTAYTEPLKTSKGTLWRVRVGPYPSHEAAVAARDKLKAEGQSGIVAAIR